VDYSSRMKIQAVRTDLSNYFRRDPSTSLRYGREIVGGFAMPQEGVHFCRGS